MKKRLLLFGLLLLALVTSGCMTQKMMMDMAMQGVQKNTHGMDYDASRMKSAGKYDQVIQLLENKEGGIADLPGFDLAHLCECYSSVKNFQKLEGCFDELERRIKSGEEKYSYKISYGAGTEIESDYRNLYLDLKNKYFADSGNYQAMLDNYNRLGLVVDGRLNYDFFLDRPRSITKTGEKTSIEMRIILPDFVDYALALALVGETTRAENYLHQFDEYFQTEYKKRLFNDGTFQDMRPVKEDCAEEEQLEHWAQKGLFHVSKKISNIYLKLGQPQKAKELILSQVAFAKGRYCGEANPLGRILFGNDTMGAQFSFDKIPFYGQWGKVLYMAGDYAESRDIYNTVLADSRVENYGQQHWNALYYRGMIALKLEGDSPQAVECFKKAIEVIESQRQTLTSESGKIGFAGDKQEVYNQLVATLLKQGKDAEAFAYVERGKARALVDLLASKTRFRSPKSNNADDLNKLLAQMDRAEIRQQPDKAIKNAEHYTRHRGIALKLKKQVAQDDLEFASLITVSPPDVHELQQLLPPDETLIEYYGFNDSLFAFVVNRESITGTPLDATGLNSKIESFRKSLQTPPVTVRGMSFKGGSKGEHGAAGATSNSLYQKILKPLEGKIATSNLTIVPHGSLHYLPFSALQTGSGYLLDKYNLRVMPSASVIKFLKNRKTDHAGNLLAFGNPDLNNPSLDLPGAEAEARAITAKSAKTKLFTRKQATETVAKTVGGQYRYVHFATHGTFDAESPLTSGLLMSSDDKNDGTLTVGELYDLNMPADLVTLSACETALGKIANGDDVVGFTRGFLYAGASSIVSSLWKVDDAATSELMQKFYGKLTQTDKRNALRDAQLYVKNNYNSHPYYWAAFQLTGAVQ